MNDTIDAQEVPIKGDSQAVAVLKKQELERSMAGTPITPAQAKVEAVAKLTMSAYERASMLELSKEEVAALIADFPDEAFQPGAAGKEALIYLEHAYLRDRLSSVFGMGKWAIVPRNRWEETFRTAKGTEAHRVYVEAMLLVRGCFVAEAVGDMVYYPNNDSQNYGDAVEGAKTAALRRCAKELGVGLQAWKKDWCAGWWQRKRGGGGRPTEQRKPQTAQAKDDDNVSFDDAPPAPTKPDPAPFPTGESRRKMIAGFGKDPSIALEYFRKLGALLPNENLEDLQLRFVPATKGQMMALCGKIADFENGSPAQEAYPPHNEPVASKAEPKPVSGGGEAWRKVIVPIPRKGQKRDEYLKSPDTIGSLYESSSTDDAARKRLFGFVHNWKPEGWNGKPPTDTDIKFRASLDEFIAWETAKRKELGESVQ